MQDRVSMEATQIRTSEVTALQAKIVFLRNENEAISKSFKEQIDALLKAAPGNASNEISNLVTENAELTALNMELSVQNMDLCAKNEKFTQKWADPKSMAECNGKLESENIKLATQNKRLSEELSQTKRQIDEMTSKANISKSRNAECIRQNEFLGQDLTSKQKQIEELKSQVSKLTDRLGVVHPNPDPERILIQRSQFDELVTTCNTLQSEKVRLTSDMAALGYNLTTFTTKNTELQIRISEFDAKMSESEKVSTERLKQMDLWYKAHQETLADRDLVRRSLDAKNLENAKLQECINKAFQQLNKLKGMIPLEYDTIKKIVVFIRAAKDNLGYMPLGVPRRDKVQMCIDEAYEEILEYDDASLQFTFTQ